jgi:hypothetical protein
MHESALIFVPAATFGQLIPKCDTVLQPLQLPRARLAMFYDVLTSVGWPSGRYASPCSEYSRAPAKLVGETLKVENSEAGGVQLFGTETIRPAAARC